MICRHCQKAKVTRPRGLCWSCFYRPGVRDQYQPLSKYGKRGPGNFNGTLPMPTRATNATPGSPEKLAILAERVRLGQNLWHPADAHARGGFHPTRRRVHAALLQQAA